MRALLLTGFLAWAGMSVHAQADTSHWQVAGPVGLFTTDELGNLYVLQQHDLDVYDRHGRRKAHNSLNRFGPITAMDASYSLKPMIFSAPLGQLALLDNTLSFQGDPMDLVRLGFPQVTLVCSSVQNRFWFFDDRELALKRVDGRLNEVASTGPLDQLLGFAPRPVYMVEADGRLYLADPEQGVLVFDLFGTYIRTLHVTGVNRMQVRDGQLWFVHNGKLHRYDMLAFHAEEVPWPEAQTAAPVLDARIEQGRLYRLTAEGVSVTPLGP